MAFLCLEGVLVGRRGELLLLFLEETLEAAVAFHAEDGDASVLGCLGKAEEDGPKEGFGGGTDGECHLCEGEDVERNATQQDDDARAEGKTTQPCLCAE